MSPPDHYGIEYEINPWMRRSQQADHAEAQRQWLALRDLLGSLGATIELLPPRAGLPDLVFTANAALIYQRRAILSRFRHVERQGEQPLDARWLTDAGFVVEELPAEMFFEGAGDALFCGDNLFAGYRKRSDARSHQEVARRLGCRVFPLELVDPRYYHLDTCFCPLDPQSAIYFPDAFDDYGRRVIEQYVPRRVAVVADEAASFACNAVVVGRTVVTNTGCPQLHAALAELGFVAAATPLGEFVKAGGSAKCLTLRLDGEEAAGWRAARE
jgi:N-dimethylarginine dimethylaminohydrolase